MGVLNIPNTLTMARILIIPVFITSIVYKRYNYALYLFVFAALTDLLDGLFARMTNQKTSLGTFLDPLADKFLLVTSFIVLTIYGWIPKWLTITVISRDIIVVTGWLILYLSAGISKIDPSVLGKTTIWIQSMLIAYILLEINFLFLPEVHRVLFFLTAAITIVSGLQYVFKGLNLSHAQ
ncbi:MAG TPA: CDP-diacylglycerol--glycerol-3-phosphate 3-phosphatidyltransferase [Thermodesulfovibrionales bacterium]|nr:CDP-diacylglycerol--glycerol-3-phosphate 3-phosphatidyltransferase [Thermodesulfovibrionales bacterium]